MKSKDELVKIIENSIRDYSSTGYDGLDTTNIETQVLRQAALYLGEEKQPMNEDEITLLKKALDLQEFVIEQNKENNYDVYDTNAFFEMRTHLSELIGVDVQWSSF